MRAVGLALTIAAASSLASAPALADDESTSTELFNAGRDLLKRGDYAAACPMLAESVRLKATVGALAKLATCEEHEHRLVSAYTRWQQALNVAQSTGDDRAEDIGRELARIDRVIPKLKVTAAGALPSDAIIRIDDTSFGRAGLGVPHAVAAGPHTITVTAARKTSWSTSVTTAADGATTDVSIPPLDDAPVAPLPVALAPAPSPVVPPPPQPSATARSTSAWPTIGLAVGATGVASLALGGVLGFVAIGKRNDANCVGTVCPNEASAATLTSAKSAAAWSTGLLVGGGMLAAGGVVLWVTSRDRSNAAVSVGIVAAPGRVAIGGSWR